MLLTHFCKCFKIILGFHMHAQTKQAALCCESEMWDVMLCVHSQCVLCRVRAIIWIKRCFSCFNLILDLWLCPIKLNIIYFTGSHKDMTQTYTVHEHTLFHKPHPLRWAGSRCLFGAHLWVYPLSRGYDSHRSPGPPAAGPPASEWWFVPETPALQR